MRTPLYAAAMGAGELSARRPVDEDRLADHRRVEPAVTVAIGLTDDLGIGTGEPAGEERCDIRQGGIREERIWFEAFAAQRTRRQRPSQRLRTTDAA
jgi:hypothetical protein